MVTGHFQLIMALALPTAWQAGRWVSLKRWYIHCGSTDEERYPCLDNLYRDILNKTCIVYYFGNADNYEFERDMGNLWCVVHAYDRTVKLPSSPGKNISFKNIGLGHLQEI